MLKFLKNVGLGHHFIGLHPQKDWAELSLLILVSLTTYCELNKKRCLKPLQLRYRAYYMIIKQEPYDEVEDQFE